MNYKITSLYSPRYREDMELSFSHRDSRGFGVDPWEMTIDMSSIKYCTMMYFHIASYTIHNIIGA